MDFSVSIMNVRWIFSQEYFLPHNKVINNVRYFYSLSTQIQKDDIAEIPIHVLALSNDPSKSNFGLLVIKLLFERGYRKATCLSSTFIEEFEPAAGT